MKYRTWKPVSRIHKLRPFTTDDLLIGMFVSALDDLEHRAMTSIRESNFTSEWLCACSRCRSRQEERQHELPE